MTLWPAASAFLVASATGFQPTFTMAPNSALLSPPFATIRCAPVRALHDGRPDDNEEQWRGPSFGNNDDMAAAQRAHFDAEMMSIQASHFDQEHFQDGLDEVP